MEWLTILIVVGIPAVLWFIIVNVLFYHPWMNWMSHADQHRPFDDEGTNKFLVVAAGTFLCYAVLALGLTIALSIANNKFSPFPGVILAIPLTVLGCPITAWLLHQAHKETAWRRGRLSMLTPEQRATHKALERMEQMTGTWGTADEYLDNLPQSSSPDE